MKFLSFITRTIGIIRARFWIGSPLEPKPMVGSGSETTIPKPAIGSKERSISPLTDDEAIQKALREAGYELRYTIEDWHPDDLCHVDVFRLVRGITHPDILRYNQSDNWKGKHPIDCLWHKIDTYTAKTDAEAHAWANENYPDASFDSMVC